MEDEGMLGLLLSRSTFLLYIQPFSLQNDRGAHQLDHFVLTVPLALALYVTSPRSFRKKQTYDTAMDAGVLAAASAAAGSGDLDLVAWPPPARVKYYAARAGLSQWPPPLAHHFTNHPRHEATPFPSFS